MASWGEGAPAVIVAQASRPSSGRAGAAVMPAKRRRVGYQSTMCRGAWTTVPAGMTPG